MPHSAIVDKSVDIAIMVKDEITDRRRNLRYDDGEHFEGINNAADGRGKGKAPGIIARGFKVAASVAAV